MDKIVMGYIIGFVVGAAAMFLVCTAVYYIRFRKDKDLEKLLEELEEAQDTLKDYSLFEHLFSKDVGIETLAKLRRSLGEIIFKVKISTIKKVYHPTNRAYRQSKKTGLVRITPCAKEYKGKTYIGVCVGDIASGSSVSIKDKEISCNFSFYNPAIFVPDLGKIILGCESWWGKLDNIEDFKEISKDEIEGVWYVKLFKAIKKDRTI